MANSGFISKELHEDRLTKRIKKFKEFNRMAYARLDEDQERFAVQNLEKALEEKLVTFEALENSSDANIRNVFKTPYGLLGLRKGLFTLADTDRVSTHVICYFMTEKGIQFLENLNGKITLFDLQDRYYKNIDDLIEKGDVQHVLKELPESKKVANPELKEIIQKLQAENLSPYCIKVNEDRMQNIIQNMQTAFEEKSVTLKQLEDARFVNIKYVFKTQYGPMGLKKGLFTLEEAEHIQANFFMSFMTEKGIKFLECLKGKVPFVDLQFYHMGNIDDLISRGDIQEILKKYNERINKIIEKFGNDNSTMRSISSYMLSEDQMEFSIKNIRKALGERILTLSDFNGVAFVTLKNIFQSSYGLIALKKGLFTLAETTDIESSLMMNLLTKKGIEFLECLKGKVTLKKLTCFNQEEIQELINERDVQKTLKQIQAKEDKISTDPLLTPNRGYCFR
jgi:hypothetical protein